MKIKSSPARKAFMVFDYIFLTIVTLISLFPLVHVLALSLSSDAAASGGLVSVLPVQFTLNSYIYIVQNPAFFRAFGISVIRVILGTVISLSFTMLSAYAMSQPDEDFHARNFYVWFFIITMIFSGGMIPLFMVVKMTKIYNTIWALVLPTAINVFNVILMQNFFKGLPRALTESAFLDGANHFQIMKDIVIPISKPSIATVSLFTIVNHWNSWFDGMIYLADTSKYPLQTYLKNVINSIDVTSVDMNSVDALKNVSQQTLTAAQIFVAIIPILIVYPFLQKYFVTGMTLGSVKG